MFFCKIILIFFSVIPMAFAWNATGHRLIAALAYEQLDAHTRAQVDALLGDDFISASVWADEVRAKGDKRMNQWHYINFYFNDKGQVLDKPYAQENVVWAIMQSQKILMDKAAGKNEKRDALRGLLHWVGDVHQPLHTVSRVTRAHPHGDRGGVLFLLAKGSAYKNLHQLWDQGAGLLHGKNKQWLVQTARDDTTPMQWAEQSFALAKAYAYSGITENTVPSRAYIERAQTISRQQLILASQRLARLLTEIFI